MKKSNSYTLRPGAGPRKLTPDQVKAIRKSTTPAYLLAREMGVCASTVKAARRYETWRDVP